MADFDVNAARKAGYSDDEILQHLTATRKFDVDTAIKSGYTKGDIINHLSKSSAESPPKTLTQHAQDFLGSIKTGIQPFLDIANVGLNPSPANAYQAGQTIIGMGQGIADEPRRIWDESVKAGQAMTQGNVPGTMYHMGGMVPLFGASAQNMTQDISKGDYGKAAGEFTVQVAPPLGAEAFNLARSKVTGPIFRSTLNATQQRAVDFLRGKVPMTAGTQTGNRFLRSLEATTQAKPLGAPYAADFHAESIKDLQDMGLDLARRNYPRSVTPETAGTVVERQLQKNIENLAIEEGAAYKDAWVGKNQPQFTYDVPVGKDATGGLIIKPVNMPVDIIDLKAKARTQLQEMRFLTDAQKASHAGYAVLKQLVTMDDFVPAWQAERALSGLKEMSMVENPNLRNVSQGTAAGLIPELQQNIDAAVANTGPDALKALQRGRATTAKKYEVAEIEAKLLDEPVQTFEKFGWTKDKGIRFFRKVQQQAPRQMAMVGRAWLEQRIKMAMEGGGFDRTRKLLSDWIDLGEETKKIMFPNARYRENLGEFFKAADMMAEKVNPSGTEVLRQATSTNPLNWLIGAAGGKLLFSEGGIKFLTEGLKGYRIPSYAPGVASAVTVTGSNQPRMTATNPQTGQKLESFDGGSTWRIVKK